MAFAAGIGAVGSLIGGLIGSGAAKKAAAAQKESAQAAAASSAKYGSQALDLTQKNLKTGEAGLQPFLQTGTQAQLTLSDLMKKPGEGLLTPFSEQFHAPSAGEAAQTPGYKFALEQGQQALENSAAARGNLFSGSTLKSLAGYTEGLASQTYGDVYQRALGEFQQRYNVFNQNQSNMFNRLSSFAGTGQRAAETGGALGSEASRTGAGILLDTSKQISGAIEAGGAARASGYLGSAQAWSNALGGAGGALSSLRLSDLSNPFSRSIYNSNAPTGQGNT